MYTICWMEILNVLTFASLLIGRQKFESSLPWLTRHTLRINEADAV